jgi:hypothetical protein
MKYRNNPWIDPRVEQVQPTNLLTYLQRQGWNERRSSMPPMRAFLIEQSDAVIYVPTGEDEENRVRFTVEAITQLARVEQRFAGDVLNDVLNLSVPTASAEKITSAV